MRQNDNPSPDTKLPLHTVVVSKQSIKEGDSFAIVNSNVDFVVSLMGECFDRQEICRESLMSFFVNELAYQCDNGGFTQWVYNTGREDDVAQLTCEGLKAVHANAVFAVVQDGLNKFAALPEKVRNRFLDGEFFGENPIHELFSAVDESLDRAREVEDLVELNAAWLTSLPNLQPLPENKLAAEVERLAALIPDQADRRRRAEDQLGDEEKCALEFCRQNGLQFQGFIAFDPQHYLEGKIVSGVTFMTNQGARCAYCHEGTAWLIEPTTDKMLGTIKYSQTKPE